MFGLGFRPPHYKEITDTLPDVDFFEIVSENFMEGALRPAHYLEKLCARYPVFMHGVSLSIASTSELDYEYLRRLKTLADQVSPSMLSDHLSWSVFQGRNSHDLLPTPYTAASLELICEKVQKVQDFLGRRFFLENPSAYVAFAQDEVPEAEFLAQLCKKSGCGVLLDVNNIYVNSHNLGLDGRSYLQTIPVDAVGYLHLAGHSQEDGLLVDTHDHPVPDGVWSLYEEAVRRWPQAPTLIEWDGNIPSFERLCEERGKARHFHERALKQKPISTPPYSVSVPLKNSLPKESLETLHENFFKSVVGKTEKTAALRAELPASADRGLGVYQNAYGIRLHEALAETFPTLAFVSGDGFGDIVTAYLKKFPPHHFSISQAGKNLESFLRQESLSIDFGVPQDFFADLAAFEWAQEESFMDSSRDSRIDAIALADIPPEKFAQLQFVFSRSMRVLELGWPVAAIVRSVAKQEVPSRPEAAPSYYLVARPGLEVIYAELSAAEREFLLRLQRGHTFIDAVVGDTDEDINENAALGAALLNKCFEWGIVSSIEGAHPGPLSFVAPH